MATIRAFSGKRPSIPDSVFLAETCAVIGDVEIGEGSTIWYGTAIRGDVMPIRIGARTSIQDNAVVHVTGGRFGTIVGSDVTVGHGAIIHACTVGDRCLIGMGAILLDGCVIGEGSLVAAGALVAPGVVIPPGSMVVGSPGKVKRPVSAEEAMWIAGSALHYVELGRAYIAEATGCSVP